MERGTFQQPFAPTPSRTDASPYIHLCSFCFAFACMCAQVTAAEAISTQWTHAVYEKAGDQQSASNFLSLFGSGCCGSMDKEGYGVQK